MKSKSNKPNAAQKKWMADIASFSISNLGLLYDEQYDYFGVEFQLHHVVGRSYKQNKVAIGHEFILPVPFELHDVSSNHKLNVTHHKRAFVDAYGTQRELFSKLCLHMSRQGYIIPPDDIIIAIRNTRA